MKHQGTLKLPPSANELVRPVAMGKVLGSKFPRMRLAKTATAAAWRTYAALQLSAQGIREPLRGPLWLRCEFTVRSISSDVTNRVKELEDALKGRAMFDDSQIVEVQLVKKVARKGEEPSVWFSLQTTGGVDPETKRRIERSTKCGGGHA